MIRITNIEDIRGHVDVVPRRDGLSVVISIEADVMPEITILIPLTDLLRYAALVKQASESPPGFEDLVFTLDKPR